MKGLGKPYEFMQNLCVLRIYRIKYVSVILRISSSWGLHLIVVRRFEYADDPESYASGSVATGKASHAGKVEG
jgi:hypothetical protein